MAVHAASTHNTLALTEAPEASSTLDRVDRAIAVPGAIPLLCVS